MRTNSPARGRLGPALLLAGLALAGAAGCLLPGREGAGPILAGTVEGHRAGASPAEAGAWRRERVRGWPGQWYGVDLPADWTAEPAGPDAVSVVHAPGPGEAGPVVKLDLARGIGLLGLPTDGWPAGTVTGSLTVAGRRARRYAPPPLRSAEDGSVSCQLTVTVPAPGGPVQAGDDGPLEWRLDAFVMGAATAADCAPALAEAELVAQSLQPEEDLTRPIAWAETVVTGPRLPGIARYTLAHPVGWMVVEGFDRVVMDGPATGAGGGAFLHLEALPGQARAEYEAAREPLGAPPGLRWVGTTLENGRRWEEYLVGDLEPTRWRVSGPDLPPDSAPARLVDQTVWRMLLNSAFTYTSVPGYP